MALSTKEIILEYVCPAMGALIGNIMFAAPVRDLKAAIDKGDLGTLNPTPWGFMLGNCMGWLLYGVLLQNVWVFVGNGPGLLVSIWLNLGAIKLLYKGHHAKENRDATIAFLDKEQPRGGSSLDYPKAEAQDWATILLKVSSQSTPAPTRHENIAMFMCTLWVIVGTVLAFVDAMDLDSKALMVGIVTNCILIFFYGAPLSTIFQVLKEKHTASIHIPTMILNTLNGIFWFAYGIAISDYFIAGPNGLGCAFGAIQIFLCMTLPRGPRSAAAQSATILPTVPAETPKIEQAEASSSTLINSYPLDMEDGTVAASA
ncbi:unnamed protein product [Cylindrotheca closterium]|uniref:Sugar transporter SWEET1 n=1 Tax=Cylindrotheca closterium TaxID=2856 RepID=A0AAD2D0X5_9STRA|nr:unnamed protein product [Cylindrotheca closterium]